jgi:hypothetical protein
MESSFTLKLSELDSDFLKTIRHLFRKDNKVTITISSTHVSTINTPETGEEYLQRLEHALKNLDKGKGITVSENDLDKIIHANKLV